VGRRYRIRNRPGKQLAGLGLLHGRDDRDGPYSVDVIDEIKLLLKVRQEVNQMVQVKAGWRTSEFWVTMLSNVIGILGIVKGTVPPQYAGYVVMALTVLNSVYTVARSFVKTTVPTVATTTVAGPATTTVTTTKP
jgi:hypothetical protein